ncbi:MAG: sulfatase-like hydrolase/transferase [Candidatus Firestonebacteria bacterium]
MTKNSDNKKPNIVFIMDDQHHASLLGCAGHPLIQTPNLDKLAKRGVRFERAFCQNGLCTPSRVSFLTGQYAHTHGIYSNSKKISNDLISLPFYLKQFGYQTFVSGKIHLPGWETVGFDRRITSAFCDTKHLPAEENDYFRYLIELGLEQYLDIGMCKTAADEKYPNNAAMCTISKQESEDHKKLYPNSKFNIVDGYWKGKAINSDPIVTFYKRNRM